MLLLLPVPGRRHAMTHMLIMMTMPHPFSSPACLPARAIAVYYSPAILRIFTPAAVHASSARPPACRRPLARCVLHIPPFPMISRPHHVRAVHDRPCVHCCSFTCPLLRLAPSLARPSPLPPPFGSFLSSPPSPPCSISLFSRLAHIDVHYWRLRSPALPLNTLVLSMTERPPGSPPPLYL